MRRRLWIGLVILLTGLSVCLVVLAWDELAYEHYFVLIPESSAGYLSFRAKRFSWVAEPEEMKIPITEAEAEHLVQRGIPGGDCVDRSAMKILSADEQAHDRLH